MTHDDNVQSLLQVVGQQFVGHILLSDPLEALHRLLLDPSGSGGRTERAVVGPRRRVDTPVCGDAATAGQQNKLLFLGGNDVPVYTQTPPNCKAHLTVYM